MFAQIKESKVTVLNFLVFLYRLMVLRGVVSVLQFLFTKISPVPNSRSLALFRLLVL